MRTYIGEATRDGGSRVFVRVHGRRHLVRGAGKDLAQSILSDVFGRPYADEDLARSHEFRQQLLLPRLRQASWSLTEADIRAWAAAYEGRRYRRLPAAPRPVAAPPRRPAASPPPPAAAPPPETPVVPPLAEEVAVQWERGETTTARLLYTTSNILLLEGDRPGGRAPPAGALLRLTLAGERTSRAGRLAAYGQGRVYLVALGSRAIRRSRRYKVNLPATIRSRHRGGVLAARVVDLSDGGARLRGIALPVGADLDVTFTPPGSPTARTLRAVVVRSTGAAPAAEIGVAFCMASLRLRPAP